MNRRVPARGIVVLAVISAVAIIAFVVFNQAFGGPGSQVGQSGYKLTVHMDESGQLLPKSLVMVNGVKVGEVTEVDAGVDGADVTFTVEPEFRPVRQGGTAQLGRRTAFGEAYVRLSRGPKGAAALASGAKVPALPTVDPDEALQIVGPGTREHLRNTIQTINEGIDGGDDPSKLRNTLASTTDVVMELRRLTKILDGQGDTVAGLIANGSTLAQALGQREATLRSIVADGQTTLQAFSSRTQALQEGITETRRLTTAAGVTVDNLPGLVDDTRPVVRDLSAATTDLKPVFDRLGPTVRSAAGVIDGLPQLSDAAVPALKDATPLVQQLEPLSAWLVPTLRNIIPLANWLAPRSNGYAAMFAHLASATASGDKDGAWLRVFLMIDPVLSFGRKAECVTPKPAGGGACTNAYPAPNDALDNQPATPGNFPRLQPAPAP